MWWFGPARGWFTRWSLRVSSKSSKVTRKVDVRQPGNGNSNSHGARPVPLIITMVKWIRTSRLLIKNSLSPERLSFVKRLVLVKRLNFLPACRPPRAPVPAEGEFFIDNLLVRIHFIIVMIRRPSPCRDAGCRLQGSGMAYPE